MKKRPPCSAETWEEIERVARNCSVPVSALVAALLDRVVTKHMRPVQWCIVAERARAIVEAQRVHRAARTAEACRRSAAARQP